MWFENMSSHSFNKHIKQMKKLFGTPTYFSCFMKKSYYRTNNDINKGLRNDLSFSMAVFLVSTPVQQFYNLHFFILWKKTWRFFVTFWHTLSSPSAWIVFFIYTFNLRLYIEELIINLTHVITSWTYASMRQLLMIF